MERVCQSPGVVGSMLTRKAIEATEQDWKKQHMKLWDEAEEIVSHIQTFLHEMFLD